MNPQEPPDSRQRAEQPDLQGMPILFREQPAEDDDVNYVHPAMTKCGSCFFGMVRVLQQRVARPKKGAEPSGETVGGQPIYERSDYDAIERRWLDVYCSHPMMQSEGEKCHRVPELVPVCQGWAPREMVDA